MYALVAQQDMQLAKTPSACCLFNACNNHIIFLMDIIACLWKQGRNIRFVEEEEFNAEMLKAAEDPDKAAVMSGLLAGKHRKFNGLHLKKSS